MFGRGYCCQKEDQAVIKLKLLRFHIFFFQSELWRFPQCVRHRPENSIFVCVFVHGYDWAEDRIIRTRNVFWFISKPLKKKIRFSPQIAFLLIVDISWGDQTEGCDASDMQGFLCHRHWQLSMIKWRLNWWKQLIKLVMIQLIIQCQDCCQINVKEITRVWQFLLS